MFLIMRWNKTLRCNSLVRIARFLLSCKNSNVSENVPDCFQPNIHEFNLCSLIEMKCVQNKAALPNTSASTQSKRFQWKPLACGLWIRSWENCDVVSAWWRLIHQTCFKFPEQHHLVIQTLIAFLNQSSYCTLPCSYSQINPRLWCLIL